MIQRANITDPQNGRETEAGSAVHRCTGTKNDFIFCRPVLAGGPQKGGTIHGK